MPAWGRTYSLASPLEPFSISQSNRAFGPTPVIALGIYQQGQSLNSMACTIELPHRVTRQDSPLLRTPPGK